MLLTRIQHASVKKRTSVWLLFLMLNLVSPGSGADEATGVTLEGVVQDNTCIFDVGSSVILPTVTRQSFTGKGFVLGITPVSVQLKSCGSGARKVDITVSGRGSSKDEFAFASSRTGDGSSADVGLYFYQSDGTTLFRPDGAVKQTVNTLTPSSDNSLDFWAGYVALSDSPVAGQFGALVNLLLEYR